MKDELHCDLGHALREEPQASRRAIQDFLVKNPAKFIAERPLDVLERTADDGGLFFVDHIDGSQRQTIACSARYDEGGYFEFGTTRIAEEFQGFGLQCAIYLNTAAHVLLDRLPEKGVFAVADKENFPSIRNLQKSGFVQIPFFEQIARDLPNKNWRPLRTGEKLLFWLPGTGMVQALRHVQENGREQILRDKRNRRLFLRLNFRWAEEVQLAEFATSLQKLVDAVARKYPLP